MTNPAKILGSVCLWLSVAICGACTLDKSHYSYIPGEKLDANVIPLPVTVSINYLDDLRGHENKDDTGMTMVPFVRYARAHYDRPEIDDKFIVKGLRPAEDFAKALQQEMVNNNLFSDVQLSQTKNSDDADLVVTGRINKASVDTSATLYGMSAFGILPWMIGLPQGRVYNSLDIQYEMRRTSDGAVVWKGAIDGKWDRLFGLYYNFSKDEPYTGINKILKDGLHDTLSALVEDIKSKPLEYWKHDTIAAPGI